MAGGLAGVLAGISTCDGFVLFWGLKAIQGGSGSSYKWSYNPYKIL